MQSVSILMATFNGEKYIREQVHSIFQQTYQDWNLWVHDDGSDDHTIEILDELEKMDNRVHVLRDMPSHLGSKVGFHALLKRVISDVYFFSDQDDFWLPDKLEVSLERLSNMSGPAMIYTDLSVVDSKLNILNKSMRKMSNYPKDITINHLIVQNSITGCTVGMNRKLRDIVCDSRLDDAIMHDWWYALAAVTQGSLEYIDQQTILYRQHSHNVVGAEHSLFSKLRTRSPIANAIQRISDLANQADSFMAQFTLSNSQSKRIFQTVARLKGVHKMHLFPELVRLRITKYGCIKNLLFYVLLLFPVNSNSRAEN